MIIVKLSADLVDEIGTDSLVNEELILNDTVDGALLLAKLESVIEEIRETTKPKKKTCFLSMADVETDVKAKLKKDFPQRYKELYGGDTDDNI